MSPAYFAHLDQGGEAPGLDALRAEFTKRNPGYDIEWMTPLRELAAAEVPRVLFVQQGEGEIAVGGRRSAATVGDIVLLRPGQMLQASGSLAALSFRVPAPIPSELPSFIRPDWDPRITDSPGGCAEESGAYRRVLLTWEGRNGPYLYHALNAHRVRMTNSFTHYHPVETGFDELYLVQMVQPGGRVIWSDRTERICSPASVQRAELPGLLQEYAPGVGDLVYMPRGTIHRGVGGVLAQVITVPGFRPGSEIGVDHHLRAINERFELGAEEALPLNEQAATKEVVK